MSEHERRKHRRYPLRMSVKLVRGVEELEATVINASAGGCLLLSGVALEKGEKLTVHMPQLRMPSAQLHVLRSQRSEGETEKQWLVATCFEAALADEAALARLSQQFGLTEPGEEEPPRVLH